MPPTSPPALRPFEPVGPALLFTDPAGATGQQLFAMLLEHTDDSFAKRGWDQPYQLLAAGRLRDLPAAVRKRLLNAHPHADLYTSLVVTELDLSGAGDAYDHLAGRVVPDGVSALLLTTEAWVSPASDDPLDPASGLRPTEHPGRQEVRHTLLTAADGSTLSRITVRGQDPGPVLGGDGRARSYGRVPDAMLRALGAATAPSKYRVGNLLAADLLAALAQWATDTGHEFGSPAVRALALGLVEDGVEDLAAHGLDAIRDDGLGALRPQLVDAFVDLLPADAAGLLALCVAHYDHSDLTPAWEPHPAAVWETGARNSWEQVQARDPEYAWMDAGMYARDVFHSAHGGTSFEAQLATIEALFGPGDRALLDASLRAMELAPWPPVELAVHQQIVGQ